jgi:hypothetical protein
MSALHSEFEDDQNVDGVRALDSWPFRQEQLTIAAELRCICGEPFASVTDGAITVFACSAMLMGKAEDGPEAHSTQQYATWKTVMSS